MRLYLRVTHGFDANFNLLTLPSDMRPPASAFVVAEVVVSGVTSVMHGDVAESGGVWVSTPFSTGDGILMWGCWAVEP